MTQGKLLLVVFFQHCDVIVKIFLTTIFRDKTQSNVTNMLLLN